MMPFPLPDPGGILIEMGLVLLLFVILSIDLVGRRTAVAGLGRCAVAGFALLILLSFLRERPTGVAFWDGMIVDDPTALWFRRFFLAAGFLVVVMARRAEDRLRRSRGAFYGLIVTATLGMCLLASANHFVLLFLALELLTISFYVLVAYEPRSMEAGLKYLIYGTVAAGIVLMGIGFVYGRTGSLAFDAVHGAVASGGLAGDPVLAAGLVLILVGIGFKVALVPFHSWAPDVYEGAPTPVAAYLSVGSKAAGFVVLLRIVGSLFHQVAAVWGPFLLIVTPLTLLYGNLGAIPQTDIKRLLGYSSIGQAGYLLLGLAAGSPLGAAAMIYFLFVYLFTNLLAFLAVALFAARTGSFRIADLSGLGRRSPILAGAMLIALLSLAGVPPLGGFFGKLLLIASVIEAGVHWLAVVAVINVAIALYYYLIVVKMIYVRPPVEGLPGVGDGTDDFAGGAPMKLLLYALMAAVILLGVFQAPLMGVCRTLAAGLIGPAGPVAGL